MLTKSLCCVLISSRNSIFRTKVTQHACLFPFLTDKVRYVSTKYLEGQTLSDDCYNITFIQQKVLNLLKKEKSSINSSEIIDAVNTLSNLHKQKKLKNDFQEKLFFKNMCALIISNLKILQMLEALEILQTLNKLGVSSSSKVIAYLLRHIDFLLDTSSIQDYNSVFKIIVNMTPTASTKVIMKSLKTKCLIKMSTDFDFNDLNLISHALQCMSRNGADMNVLNIMFEALHHNSFESATLENAILLFKSLIYMQDYPQGWVEILNKIYSVLIKNLHQITNSDMLYILKSINFKLENKRIEEFYNQNLLDQFAQKIILNDVDLNISLECLLYFNNFRHVHKDLLSYISAKYYEHEHIVQKNNIPKTKSKSEILLILITGLAYLKYKPFFWPVIYDSLSNENMSEHNLETLIIYSSHLACLDCYNPIILNRIFNQQNFPKNPFLSWTYLRMWQKLITIPNYDGPTPSENDIEMFSNLVAKPKELLLSTLEQGLGGSIYVKKSLKTKLHHFIDAVIAFRSGGYPIAINDNKNSDTVNNDKIEYLEDLKVSSNSHMFVILYVPPNWYFRNTEQLLGPFIHYIESIKALSNVITINGRKWDKLSEKSRLLFLMNEINTNVKSNETISFDKCT